MGVVRRVNGYIIADEKFKEKRPSYKDITCSNEWLYYENFKKWHDENYYEIENERMCLDKDILSHNLKLDRKIYSSRIYISGYYNDLEGAKALKSIYNKIANKIRRHSKFNNWGYLVGYFLKFDE